MQIRELLNENKKKSTNQPETDKSELDQDLENPNDSESEQNSEEQKEIPGVEDFVKQASSLGFDLYTITGLNYNDDFDLGKSDPEINRLLSQVTRKLPDMKMGANFMKKADGEEGAMAQVFLNARNGAVFTMEISEIGVQMNPTNWIDLVDNDQAVKVNKIVRMSEKYAGMLANLSDRRSYNKAEAQRESIMWELNFDDQKWPMSKKDQEIVDYNKKSVEQHRQKLRAKYAAELEKAEKEKQAEIDKNPAGRDKR